MVGVVSQQNQGQAIAASQAFDTVIGMDDRMIRGPAVDLSGSSQRAHLGHLIHHLGSDVVGIPAMLVQIEAGRLPVLVEGHTLLFVEVAHLMGMTSMI